MKLHIATQAARFLRTAAPAVTHHPRRLNQSFSAVRRWLVPVIIGLQVLTSVAEETSRERQDRVYREEQRSRDTEAYLASGRAAQSRNQYAAIAFSEATGRWGYGFGYASLASAKQEAFRRCGANDAEILCWSQNGSYCALADGPNSHGSGFGSTAAEAQARALADAARIAPGARIVVCVRGLQ